MAKSGSKIAVHIIESPRDSDREDRRFEGAALAEAMTLFRIPYTVHDVRTKASFQAAFEDIINWHAQHRRPRRIPVIHLSAHGDRKGLEVTSGDDILWSTVAQCVGRVASKCDEDPAVAMSSCEGYFARAMRDELGDPPPYRWLVGTERAPTWRQTLMAFTTLYFQLVMGVNVKKAVDVMNRAARRTFAVAFK